MSFKKKDGNSVITGDFTILNKLVEGLSQKHSVDVGILDPAIATYMAVHEYGSPTQNIPARSWLNMPLSRKNEIEKAVRKKAQSLLERGDVRGVYKLLGEACEDQIRGAFDTAGFGTWAPSNSPSPLVDTGAARNAVTSKIRGAK